MVTPWFHLSREVQLKKSPKRPYSHCFSPHRKRETCHTISKMNPESHVSSFVFLFFVSIRHSREMKRTWQAFLIRAILNRTGKNFCFSKIHCVQRGKRLMEICCLFWKHKWPQNVQFIWNMIDIIILFRH